MAGFPGPGLDADFFCVGVVMRAIGIDLPMASNMLVLLSVNLVLALPAVPANVGALEFTVMAVLRPLGVPTQLGLALGLLYHLVQVLPVATLALLDGRFAAARGLRDDCGCACGRRSIVLI